LLACAYEIHSRRASCRRRSRAGGLEGRRQGARGVRAAQRRDRLLLPGWLDRAPLVLYFYPKDGTSGCTKEACALRDDFSAFRGLNATVVGFSYDSLESLRKFIAKHRLPFPLAADVDRSVAKAFGVDGWLFAHRATFIVGRDGTILYANPKVDPSTHSREIRDALARLAAAPAPPAR